MAWRIHDLILRGEVDNRQRGTVRGRLWLHGRTEPVDLQLTGNCGQDLAGCRLEFSNPAPRSGEYPIDQFAAVQAGIVGEMTAARKVRILDVSLDEARQLAAAGQPVPEHRSNALYLEWFSEANGRVVIESADYRLSVSEPAWRLSDAEDTQQRATNADALRRWLERLSDALPTPPAAEVPLPADAGAAAPPEEDEAHGPMDEFEWERAFREADARTDKYLALQEKYRGHPDAERLIAREMGWDWVEEVLDADEQGALPEESEPDEPVPEPQPNPLTEGVDWIRTKRGRICHPLQHRAHEAVMAIWHYCQEHGRLGDAGDPDLHEMVFQAQTATAKMAGALHGLPYEDDVREPGFIVAALKRALSYLHDSLGAADRVAAKKLIEPGRLAAFRQEMFEIRTGILSLMDRFRAEQR